VNTTLSGSAADADPASIGESTSAPVQWPADRMANAAQIRICLRLEGKLGINIGFFASSEFIYRVNNISKATSKFT
jgi:hypothetical protein